MNKYDVKVIRTVDLEFFVKVMADDYELAEEKALDYVYNLPEGDADRVITVDAFVVDIEQVPNERD